LFGVFGKRVINELRISFNELSDVDDIIFLYVVMEKLLLGV